MNTARKLATWDDLLDLPEGVRAEVIGGAVCMSPSARAVHGFSVAALAARIFPRFGSGSDGAGHDVVRPDITGWRRARMPRLPDDVPVDLTPDWVCEVLSPSNEALDRSAKMPLYASAGVPHAWLVDPAERMVEAYELHDGRWTLLGVWTDGAEVEVAPFGGLVLDVAGLFPPKDPVPAAGG